jgi:DNA-binding IclR family transcriptional regulator
MQAPYHDQQLPKSRARKPTPSPTGGSQPNQSLIDGLACLEALAVADEAIGCRDLGRRLGIHHVRANRLLKSLAEAGFAEQDHQRRYRPGPGFHVLAVLAMHGSGLIRRALPHLERLARDTGATIALGMLWRAQVCYLFHGDASTPSAEALGRTRLIAAEDSSIGHVLLAAQGESARAAALAEIPAPRQRALKLALKAVKRDGYACLEHSGAGTHRHHSIAVTVGSPIFAGIAATGVHLDRPIGPIVASLIATAEKISQEHA